MMNSYFDTLTRHRQKLIESWSILKIELSSSYKSTGLPMRFDKIHSKEKFLRGLICSRFTKLTDRFWLECVNLVIR